MYRKREKKDKKKLKAIILTIVIVMALVITLVIIFYKSKNAKPKVTILNTSSQSSKKSSSSQTVSQKAEISSANNSSLVSTNSVTSSSASSSNSSDTSYLSDALFIGDSLTEGIEGYGVMPNTYVAAGVGLSLNNIINKADSAKIKCNGVSMSILDVVAVLKPKKLYLLLGINEINYITPDQLCGLYKQFIDKIRERVPNAIIYIQSITPTTEDYEANKNPGVNAKINEHNLKLVEFTKNNNLYYLNIAEIFKDSKGYLLANYSGGDGLHFNDSGYKAWMDYVLAHTVK
jgi:lysophospholipase L1-like esterase